MLKWKACDDHGHKRSAPSSPAMTRSLTTASHLDARPPDAGAISGRTGALERHLHRPATGLRPPGLPW